MTIFNKRPGRGKKTWSRKCFEEIMTEKKEIMTENSSEIEKAIVMRKILALKILIREFPGSPLVRTWHFHYHGQVQLLVKEMMLAQQTQEWSLCMPRL